MRLTYSVICVLLILSLPGCALLSNVGSKNACTKAVSELNARLAEQPVYFAVVMADMNNADMAMYEDKRRFK